MSDSETQTILGVMRSQAWERSKGELQSILTAYVGDRERFERMEELIDEFVQTVQDEGLAE